MGAAWGSRCARLNSNGRHVGGVSRAGKRELEKEPTGEAVDSISAAPPLSIVDVGMDPASRGQTQITITQQRVCGGMLCRSGIGRAPRRQ